ncbi:MULTISPECIES: hypothetical protein [unclassified Bradyrhizobium]|uniref:hypothetical protein n=1 Tax=unclassified Bradyrhizobium TaxID=2631580 RepID=UPI0028EBC1A7|nr:MULTISPECIES: hypothetical protein [unclassified Bradyrhizobium]
MYVADFVKQCVLFIGNRDDNTNEFVPRGTGFIVTLKEGPLGFRYLVTAEHVIRSIISRGWDVLVRSNLLEGGVREDSWAGARWYTHPTESCDVAIATIDMLPDEEFKQIVLRSDEPDRGIAATAEAMKQNRWGLGDEVLIVGLFISHYGRRRNVPIVRVGNLSMMREEPVYTRYCGELDAYLVEARSIGGISGSPVFLHTPLPNSVNATQIRLLGLVHGHFDVSGLTGERDEETEGRARGGINTGIGVVIPVERILETLDQAELVAIRRSAVVEAKGAEDPKSPGRFAAPEGG